MVRRTFKISKEELEKHIIKGDTYKEIANKYGFVASAVCQRIKKFGLNKKHNIKRGLRKGTTPKNLESLHIKGSKNQNWKGDKVGYMALHDWVRRTLGKPKYCEHCKTTEAKMFDWANISGKYKRNIKDWKRLCRSCHIKYDNKKKRFKQNDKRD